MKKSSATRAVVLEGQGGVKNLDEMAAKERGLCCGEVDVRREHGEVGDRGSCEGIEEIAEQTLAGKGKLQRTEVCKEWSQWGDTMSLQSVHDNEVMGCKEKENKGDGQSNENDDVAAAEGEIVGLQQAMVEHWFPTLMTAGGKIVEVQQSSLEAARESLGSAPKPSSFPTLMTAGGKIVELLPTLMTAGGKMVEVQQSSLEAARESLGSAPKPSSFPTLMTAGGKMVEVQQSSLEAARESLGSAPKPSSLPTLMTAGGKMVEVQQSSLEAARVSLGSAPKPSSLPTLMTAGGKMVEVQQSSLEAARESLGSAPKPSSLPTLMTAGGKMVEVQQSSLEAARESLGSAPKPSSLPTLMTAGGKMVEVQQSSLEAARESLGSAPKPSSLPTLMTAGGKMAEVQQSSLEAVRESLGSAPKPSSFPTLMTAGGKMVEVQQSSLEAARESLGSAPKPSSFPTLITAGGKMVEVQQSSLEAARAKVHLAGSHVHDCVGIVSGSAQFIANLSEPSGRTSMYINSIDAALQQIIESATELPDQFHLQPTAVTDLSSCQKAEKEPVGTPVGFQPVRGKGATLSEMVPSNFRELLRTCGSTESEHTSDSSANQFSVRHSAAAVMLTNDSSHQPHVCITWGSEGPRSLASGGSGGLRSLASGGSGGPRSLASGGSEGPRSLASGGSGGPSPLASGSSGGPRSLASGGSGGPKSLAMKVEERYKPVFKACTGGSKPRVVPSRDIQAHSRTFPEARGLVSSPEGTLCDGPQRKSRKPLVTVQEDMLTWEQPSLSSTPYRECKPLPRRSFQYGDPSNVRAVSGPCGNAQHITPLKPPPIGGCGTQVRQKCTAPRRKMLLDGNSTVQQSGNSTVQQSGNSTVQQSQINTVQQSGNSTVQQSQINTVQQSGNSTVQQSQINTVQQSGNSTVQQSRNSTSQQLPDSNVKQESLKTAQSPKWNKLSSTPVPKTTLSSAPTPSPPPPTHPGSSGPQQTKSTDVPVLSDGRGMGPPHSDGRGMGPPLSPITLSQITFLELSMHEDDPTPLTPFTSTSMMADQVLCDFGLKEMTEQDLREFSECSTQDPSLCATTNTPCDTSRADEAHPKLHYIETETQTTSHNLSGDFVSSKSDNPAVTPVRLHGNKPHPSILHFPATRPTSSSASRAPQVGTLLAMKLTHPHSRVPLKAAVCCERPGRYSSQQLALLGACPSVAGVTSATAGAYRFVGAHHFSEGVQSGGVEVCGGDGAMVKVGRDGMLGAAEMWEAFSRSPGVDQALVSPEWFSNHYRWVVWKLAAMEVSFPHRLGGRCLTPDWLMLQMKYRYDREIDLAQRPALRKICEGDDVPSRTMILCVSHIDYDLIQGPSHHQQAQVSFGNDSKLASPPDPPCVVLTDGWYSLPGILDAALKHAVRRGVVRVGTKVITSGAELVGGSGPTHPLEAPPTLALKLSANSTRRVRWFARLGYHRSPLPIRVPLESTLPTGGLVGNTEVLVSRVYPPVFMERVREGGVVFRSRRAEEGAESLYQARRQREMEKVYQRVQREMEDEMAREGMAV
ncbi:hypothetical protein EMCRGX_G033299 [Ephydatia muelleri]